MIVRKSVLSLILVAMGACTSDGTISTSRTNFISELPQEVISIAAPFQNLEAVQLKPEDNCYWYEHNGPVETTFLPLRTKDGRPICVRQEEPAAEQAAG